MDIKKKYERWLANATADADVAVELNDWMIQKLKMLFTVILPLERAVCAALLAQEPTV